MYPLNCQEWKIWAKPYITCSFWSCILLTNAPTFCLTASWQIQTSKMREEPAHIKWNIWNIDEDISMLIFIRKVRLSMNMKPRQAHLLFHSFFSFSFFLLILKSYINMKSWNQIWSDYTVIHPEFTACGKQQTKHEFLMSSENKWCFVLTAKHNGERFFKVALSFRPNHKASV